MIDEEKRIKHELYEIRIQIEYLKKRQVELNSQLNQYYGEKNLVRNRERNKRKYNGRKTSN